MYLYTNVAPKCDIRGFFSLHIFWNLGSDDYGRLLILLGGSKTVGMDVRAIYGRNSIIFGVYVTFSDTGCARIGSKPGIVTLRNSFSQVPKIQENVE